MPFLASSFMMQAPVYQDVNQPIEDRVVDAVSYTHQTLPTTPYV